MGACSGSTVPHDKQAGQLYKRLIWGGEGPDMASMMDRIRGMFPARQPARPFSEQGVAGYVVMGGYVVSNEQNPKLFGQTRWRTAADILSNCSVVAAGLRYTLNLIARPAWKADPVNDTAEAKAMAEFVDEIMDDASASWTRIIRRSAMYRFHGFGISEWTAKRRDDGRTGIDSIEQRPQHTIERWDIDPNGGVLGVWQRDPQTSREIYLPRQKLVYLVDDQLTDRPDGMGWFRHLVEPAERLTTYMKLESLGFQRDLTGIPIGRAPLQKINQLVKDGKLTQEQADQMIEGIKEFCRLEMKSEHTGLILDSTTYKGKTQEGDQISQVAEWGMELLTGEQTSIEALGKAILRLDEDIALIMGTTPMLTGRGGEGSRALSEDQSRNLYLTVNSTLDDMTESYQRDIVDRLWAMNGLNDDLKPRLAHEDASFKDIEKIGRVLRDMAAAGAILAPDDPAINDVRNLAGLSEAEPMDIETLALIRNGPPQNDPNADPNAKPQPKPAPKPKPKGEK
jgi:polyhydroxyalkanoate synthesis regulator phasin